MNSWFYLATALIIIATEVVKLIKYSLASSLLHAVPSTRSLALKKFMYVSYTYIDKSTNFYAFPWHIEQYRSVFTTESHVQHLDNP